MTAPARVTHVHLVLLLPAAPRPAMYIHTRTCTIRTYVRIILRAVRAYALALCMQHPDALHIRTHGGSPFAVNLV